MRYRVYILSKPLLSRDEPWYSPTSGDAGAESLDQRLELAKKRLAELEAYICASIC